MQLGKGARTVVSEVRSTPFFPALHYGPPHRSCRADAGRERSRDGRGRSGGPGVTSVTFPRIQTLLPEHTLKDGAPPADAAAAAELTVYTIRFMTGASRGAALSDPNSAVNVCLIGQNGAAVLHRVSPVNDPIESRAHTLEMCQMIGPDVGADCSVALADSAAGGQQQGTPPPQGQQGQRQLQGGGGAAGNAGSRSTSTSKSGSGAFGFSSSGTSLVGRPPPPPPPKRRFQEGSVDEVSILVPELGPLSGVLVGVEGGTWYLDEMDVSSSRTHHLDRFVCRRTLGGKAGEGAAALTPVPAGAVVYGEGEAAVVLSKDQAEALWSLNMSDYSELKRRLAATTALLVASGASLAAITGGTAAALPYTAGGVVGLVYQWLLMRGVDDVVEAASGQGQRASVMSAEEAEAAATGGPPAAASPQQRQRRAQGSGFRGGVSAGGAAGRLLASAPVRLGFVCASAALGLALLSQEEAATEVAKDAANGAGGDAASGSAAAWQLALAALGFLTYKVALVGVSLGDSAGSGGGLGGGNGLGAQALSRSLSGGANDGHLEKFKRDSGA